jgi:phosphate transport system protein
MSTQIEGHTIHRYDGELRVLHDMVLNMGAMAQRQTLSALQAMEDQDTDLARKIIERDQQVNEQELRIDEEIVAIIARRSPMARDLRAIMSMSKAVTDLERIGDEAARVAERVVRIFDNDGPGPSASLTRDITTMGKLVAAMLQDALEAFRLMDVERAERMAAGHTELDAEFQSSLRRLATFVMEDSRTVGHTINVTLITKSLERIGDHARNIAEYIIYLVKGKDVRHHIREAGDTD